MLYKDQILIHVIKKQEAMERAEVIKDPKSDLNILLELSGKNYEVCCLSHFFDSRMIVCISNI